MPREEAPREEAPREEVPRQIAYIEDDPAILANYCELLADAGFEVCPFSTKKDALSTLLENPPDLALIDVTLHHERDAGFDICQQLRSKYSDLPIIFLTSHDREMEKISGLRLGADDYITKDASLDYIIVRIESLFRRAAAFRGQSAGAIAEKQLSLGKLRLDNQFSLAYWNENPLDLSLTHYWILKELVKDPGTAKSHQDLMIASNIVVESNTIAAHIRAIRAAFYAVDERFDNIRTERGRGYRWVTD